MTTSRTLTPLLDADRSICQEGTTLYTARKQGDGSSPNETVGAAHLHEAHSNSAHFGEFVHCLETMVHRLCQELSKLLVVENFQAAPAGDLADSSGVEAVMVVAIPTLHEDAAVAEAFGVHLSSNVIEVDSCRGQTASVTGRRDTHTGLRTGTQVTRSPLCQPLCSGNNKVSQK